ncbi:hypothetical protein NPIL_586601 [Nephila pilipes]|uniref:Uncharacterized protein n=1 Tax=Nephila pilipes TaxID=299642 RepID=A0A8X6I3L6_NEPPI|nr:hypothetical protein NPIL_586601 [Nephila pilipes]
MIIIKPLSLYLDSCDFTLVLFRFYKNLSPSRGFYAKNATCSLVNYPPQDNVLLGVPTVDELGDYRRVCFVTVFLLHIITLSAGVSASLDHDRVMGSRLGPSTAGSLSGPSITRGPSFIQVSLASLPTARTRALYTLIHQNNGKDNENGSVHGFNNASRMRHKRDPSTSEINAIVKKKICKYLFFMNHLKILRIISTVVIRRD